MHYEYNFNRIIWLKILYLISIIVGWRLVIAAMVFAIVVVITITITNLIR